MLILVYGVVFFPGLFIIFNKVLAATFKQWNDADVVVVSERLVSSIHAVMATTAGVIILISCNNNVMTDRHWLATDFVWFGAPYMLYDMFAMYLVHYHHQRVTGYTTYKEHSLHTVNQFLRRDFLLVLHHTVLLAIFMPISLLFRRGLGDFFIGCLFTTELSTPFVAIGKILIQLGLQDCWLHKVNGLMVLLSFFMCRILLFPFMYWVYGRKYSIPFYRVPFHLPLHCNVGNSAILAPQLYWFALLCRKGYRLYLRQGKTQSHPFPKDRTN